MVKKICKNCRKVFLKNPRFSKKQWGATLYCSGKCSAFVNGKKLLGKKLAEEHKRKIIESLKKVVHTEEWNKKVGLGNTGKVMSTEARRKMSLSKKGHQTSLETRRKIGLKSTGRKHSVETRKRMSEMRKGENSPNWKGGVSKPNELVRKGLEIRLWREAVFSRDDWTCQECGIRGGTLNADHIKPFSKHPELRTSIENGRTLCISCHRKTPTYGSRT